MKLVTLISGQTGRLHLVKERNRGWLRALIKMPHHGAEQSFFQPTIIPVLGQGPGDTGRLGAFQILMNRTLTDRQLRAIWRWPNPNSNRSRRTSFSFRMDSLFMGNRGPSTFEWPRLP